MISASIKARSIETLESFAKVHPHSRNTPYIITDLRTVASNIRHFKEILPNVEIYYAIKANRDLPVLRTAHSLVSGYDIASLGELMHIMKIGADPAKVLYSNPVKIPRHIKGAYKLGVRNFAFDSVPEIAKLAKNAPGSNAYLRLKVSDYGSKFPLSKKFGIDQMYASDYCSMAEDAGLHVKGLTFHVGSQSENLAAWRTAIEIVGKTITQLKQKGINIEFVDLGGGFPADYGEPVPSMIEIAKTIKSACKEYLPEGIRLFAEPGRYVAANSSTLVTTVIGREHRSGAEWLYLDVGVFQGLMEPLEMPGWKYPVWSDKNPNGSTKTYVLTGPTCDAYDTLGTDYTLPSDLTVGDKVYIGAVGAYGSVYASRFNGFLPPKTFYITEE